MALNKSRADDLLKWLEDDGDIYIPNAKPTTTPKAPVVASPPPSATSPAKTKTENTTNITAPQPSPSIHRDPVQPTQSVSAVSLEIVSLLNAVNRFNEEEVHARHTILLDYQTDVGLLSQSFWQRVALLTNKELVRQRTMMHNRELISSDLVQELYQANQTQRQELEKMFGFFQQLAAQRNAAPAAGGKGKR